MLDMRIDCSYKPIDIRTSNTPLQGESPMKLIRIAAVLALIAGTTFALPPASAAESYDNCKNFIDSVPTTISTPGVWCLRKDLATGIANGTAIHITANNVTIDCNDFKIGGLAAGSGASTYGIAAYMRQNVTVRNCNVRGFRYGIDVSGGAGHLVEDNRLDNNLYIGIYSSSDNTRIRRNAVYDTGGATNVDEAWGIYGTADVVDNTVSGLFADSPGGRLVGIHLAGTGNVARENKVSGFDTVARQGGNIDTATGLVLNNSLQRASGNQIAAEGPVNGSGIFSASSDNYCLDNTVGGFSTNIPDNCISSGNLTSP